jgi:DNA-binding IclR family transcriptional regulator
MIVEFVAKSAQPVALAELAKLLGIDRSSVFRLANTLKRRGFLAHPSGRKDYILGPALWRLSHHYDWGDMLVKIAHSYLKELSAQTGETAHLAIREGDKALFVDHVSGNHVIAVSGQVGDLVPLYCTAHGKALLADLNARQLRALFLAEPLKAYTARTIVSLDALADECARVKELGYARDDGEYQEGLRCVAGPIRDQDGTIIGSIGISAPANRVPDHRFDVCIWQVVTIARAISESLGRGREKAAAQRE